MSTGRTALSLACRGRRLEIARLLLKYGANPNARDDSGRTPLFWACSEAEERQDSDRFSKAVRGIRAPIPTRNSQRVDENFDLVKTLLESGSDLNLADPGGNTAIMEASRLGKEQVVSLLLATGVNLNDRNRAGLSALDIAMRQGHLSIVSLLRQYDAK